jgi:uncharacterized repeat protein (TIGR03803 family)
MVGAKKRGTTVTITLQRSISKVRLGASSAALTFVVVLGLGVVTTQSAQAQTFTVLHNFTGSSDGGNPYAGMVRDTLGNFYSTASGGGSSSNGVVFKLSKSGAETVLYNFTGGNDGGEPLAGLIRDTAGNFYGTTFGGGSSGNGVVFKLSKSGTERVLYSFAGGSSDGAHPWGSLIQDDQGNFYGTTVGGGSSNWGTVFKLSKTGRETVLHSFVGGSDGEFPYYTSLLMDKNGNLYGITSQGGTSNSGVVFKLSRSGKLTVLHSFTGGTKDGCYPYGTPALDTKGNLYGTTYKCGSSGQGIVWKVDAKSTETVLHNFAGGSSDGAYPYAGVTMDAKGNFYGDTAYGGSSGDGTVYELNKKGKLTLLHSFTGADGELPIAGLARDAKGNFYSTAFEGGSGGYGTVWKLTP